MTQAYVVTESQDQADILKRLTPEEVTGGTVFVDGGDTSSAETLASTILTIKRRPVVLVVNAYTEYEQAIRERQNLINDLLAPTSARTPFKVILAAPELEVVFFSSEALLQRLTRSPSVNGNLELARHFPGQFLDSLPGRRAVAIQQILDGLTPTELCELRAGGIIAELSAFLTAVTQASRV